MDLSIEKTREGSTLKITLSGELNTVTAPDLDKELKSELATCDNIVFDMSDLFYITSAGLRIMLVCQQEVEERGEVIIRGVSPEIREVFEIAGFDTILTIE